MPRSLLLIAVMPLVVTPAFAAVTISSDATANMTCSGGVCSPTAKNAVLNAGDLETLLASGNVTVTTTGSGVQAKDIDVKIMRTITGIPQPAAPIMVLVTMKTKPASPA